MIEGSEWSEFLSTFKFVSFTKLPTDNGNSNKKFSVRINSWRLSHLKNIKIEKNQKLIDEKKIPTKKLKRGLIDLGAKKEIL